MSAPDDGSGPDLDHNWASALYFEFRTGCANHAYGVPVSHAEEEAETALARLEAEPLAHVGLSRLLVALSSTYPYRPHETLVKQARQRLLQPSGALLRPPTADDTLGLLTGAPVLGAVPLPGVRILDFSEHECPSGNFDRRQLSDPGGRVLARALSAGRFPDLVELDVDRANLGPSGAIALAASLQAGACPQLAVLNLRSNFIAQPGAVAVAKALGGLPALRELQLANNGICSAQPLVTGILRRARDLRLLSLWNNVAGNDVGPLVTLGTQLLDLRIAAGPRAAETLKAARAERREELRRQQLAARWAVLLGLRDTLPHSAMRTTISFV